MKFHHRQTSLLIALTLLVALMGGGDVWAGNGTPAGFQKWQVDDTTFRSRLGGDFANYPEIAGSDTTWTAINNDWIVDGPGDSAYCNTDILKTSVQLDGETTVRVEWNGTEYTATQNLVKLVWINTATWNWVDVTEEPVSWSVPTVNDSTIKWANVFPGVNYEVNKANAGVSHAIKFRPAFLDSAVTLYDQRSDSSDIALANVMTYTLSATCDDADSAIGTVPRRKLKQLGKYHFSLTDQYVHFPRPDDPELDTLPILWVKQRWERRDNKIVCAEYVMMKHLKALHEMYPTATIWHNDVAKVEGTTDVEDTYINAGSGGANRGGYQYLIVQSDIHTLMRVKNVASNLGVGATISAAVCSVYCMSNTTNETISAYRIFKPWVEGAATTGTTCPDPSGATSDDWDCTDYEWTTAGCNSADDGGSDNSGDGTGADRKATAEDAELVDAVGWFEWSVTTALAQGWYDETINEEGIKLHRVDGTNWFRSSETGEAEKPFWTFTYTTAAPATGRRARVMKLLGR